MIRGRISAPGLDLSENYELLVNRIQRPLERIDGVGQVEMDGVMPLEIHVDLRQADLDRHGLRWQYHVHLRARRPCRLLSELVKV